MNTQKPPSMTSQRGSALAGFLESILTLFWVLAWLFAAMCLVLPLVDSDSASFMFTTDIQEGMWHKTQGPGGTWTLKAVSAEVTPPRDRTWIASLVALPFALLLAYAVGQLRSIFRSLRQGSPFVAANARRLRRIGVAVLVLEVLRTVVTLTVVGPAFEELEPVVRGGQGLQASAWPDLGFVFFGLAVLVLAEVFRRGTQMQDEQALTV